jgi:threonine/homoserine/homoserine lactone efflux protein
MAIAIALSPFAVIPAVLLLFTPRPRPAALAFTLGWFFGIAVWASAGALLADVLELGSDTSTVAGWLRALLGAAMVVLAIRTWLRRNASTDPPGWMSSIRSSEPRDAFKLGLVLTGANPKVLLLAGAGGSGIAAEVSPLGGQLVGVLLFSAVATLTVVTPLIAFVVLGERALSPLDAAGRWLDRNNQVLVAIILLAIGAGLFVSGVETLTT